MDQLEEIQGTKWTGTAELWLDPLGDEVTRSDCTMAVEEGAVQYTWSHEGQEHRGSLKLGTAGPVFCDSWHQPEAMSCRLLSDAWGLIQVQGEYGPDADWGWRIGLFLRAPTDQLVLQMTNIAPWGEEARAVRVTCSRA